MIYYTSKVHDTLYGLAFSPELVTDTLCLNPQYPVTLSKPCRYILDYTYIIYL